MRLPGRWRTAASAALAVGVVVGIGVAAEREWVDAGHRREFVGEFLASGDMTASEANRLYDISNKNVRSADDADWMIAAANAPCGATHCRGRLMMLGVILEATDRAALTPARREAMFQIAARLTAMDGPGESGCQYTAFGLFRILRDKRAIPYLQQMTDSPEKIIRFDSRRLLHQMARSAAPAFTN